MRLNLTPLSDRRGSLHTSISHCTRESGSPCKHTSRYFSDCSKSQSLAVKTRLISAMMLSGCSEEVVFMFHVKRNERGLVETVVVVVVAVPEGVYVR